MCTLYNRAYDITDQEVAELKKVMCRSVDRFKQNPDMAEYVRRLLALKFSGVWLVIIHQSRHCAKNSTCWATDNFTNMRHDESGLVFSVFRQSLANIKAEESWFTKLVDAGRNGSNNH
jgi:hypothetical protein